MRFRVLVLTALVMSCALRLQATPQSGDPRLIINNGHDLADPLTVIMGLEFTFMADASGGGVLDFTNGSGEKWTSLKIETRGTPPENTIICGGTAFATCSVQPQPEDGFTVIDFSGGAGIPNGGDFTIDLGTSGWRPDEQFRAFANPEPGTLTLFMIGLTPLLARRIGRLGVRNR